MGKKRQRSGRMTPDPIDIPYYHLGTAARWVGVPASTLRKWMYGRSYTVNGKKRFSGRLIAPADSKKGRLSIANIAEAHILSATRGDKISMFDIRWAIDEIQKEDPTSNHPLLSKKLFRRGGKLFVELLKQKVAAHRPIQGQPFLNDFEAYLERIEIATDGHIRLFPIRRNEKKTVVLNSDVAGGQPIIAGRGILVEHIQDLKKSGLSVEKIAGLYALDRSTIDQAIAFIRPAA